MIINLHPINFCQNFIGFNVIKYFINKIVTKKIKEHQNNFIY